MSGRQPKPVRVYVSAAGNEFMTDIARWLVEAADLCGRPSTLVTDDLPDDPDVINLVVAPHEFYLLNNAAPGAINAAAAVSTPVCTEQPGTPWFWMSHSFCRPSAVTLDINDHGIDALIRHGVVAERLILGGVPGMVAPAVDRDIDVLFLGGDMPRRRAMLSSLGPMLADRRAELRLFHFTSPVATGVPGLVFGADKYRLLARSRILVNIHRSDAAPGYFEWARLVEAMANGCTVVTEACTGFEPLVPDAHFVVTDDLATTVGELLDDPTRCARIGDRAAAAVLEEYPLVRFLRPVLDRLDDVDQRRPGRRRARIARHNRPILGHGQPIFAEYRPAGPMRERVFGALLREQQLRRDIDAARCARRHGAPGHIVEHTSTAYQASIVDDRPVPEVSVIVSLFDYAGVVVETLDSIIASRDVDLEIVVVDDHSTDEGRAVVADFVDAHPDVPMLLLGREDNHGLAPARNLGIERARTDKIMVMDADNTLYPACLRRLADALDDDPSAAFAYAMLEAFGVHPGLRSHLGWYPPWLCAANYIDAQAMVRASTYERHGGYLEDDEWTYGWEDWDFWLRLAAAGEYGVHIPQMLGRYRTQQESMISITRLASETMRQRIKARYPSLPWNA